MKEKTNKYSYQRLKDYALWYYFRYFPSNKKLENKLLEKWDREDATKVFSDIKSLLQEEQIVESKIRAYLDRNKNINYIKNKLTEKLFPKDLINQKLLELTVEWETVLSEDFVERKILEYISKWKSKNYIKNALIERKEDREIVEKSLDKLFHSQLEIDLINSELSKIKYKNISTNKKIEKLMRKWFSYNSIKECI